MFEPSSAMTLIAEDGEFRFARFYIVCEAVPLGAKIRQEEMLTFFSNECSICISI